MANENPGSVTNYALSDPPADAIYNVEFNITDTNNSCNWAFTVTDSTGAVGDFTKCQFDLMGRFPGLAYRYHVFIFANGEGQPSGIVVSPGTWQADVQQRENQIAAVFPNFSAFFSVDIVNEPFYTNLTQPNPPPLSGGPWGTAGGVS